jgi:transposase InsO family protein
MPKKGHSEEQIIGALKQYEGGEKSVDICLRLGISQATFYMWKKQYAGLGVQELHELRQLREIAATHVRYGYRRLTVLLKREGWKVNAKRVYRLYDEENLKVRSVERKKIARRQRVPQTQAEQPNDCWSADFVSDKLADGRTFRILTVIGQFTRECVWLEADRLAGSILYRRHAATALREVCPARYVSFLTASSLIAQKGYCWARHQANILRRFSMDRFQSS